MKRDYVALTEYIEDRESWAFGYSGAEGEHDCGRFAAGAILAQTGVDKLADFVGSWTTEAGAARVIRKHGGMAEAVSSVLTEVPAKRALRGDIALMPGDALGVIEGASIVCLAGNGGYVRHPRAAMIKAWSAV